MTERFPSTLLRTFRNDIPISHLIRSHLNIPSKDSEGYFRFLCPLCNEFHTATNPKTNLARCFRCRVNFNPIDMVTTVKRCGFVDAVKILTPLVNTHAQRSSSPGTAPAEE